MGRELITAANKARRQAAYAKRMAKRQTEEAKLERKKRKEIKRAWKIEKKKRELEIEKAFRSENR